MHGIRFHDNVETNLVLLLISPEEFLSASKGLHRIPLINTMKTKSIHLRVWLWKIILLHQWFFIKMLIRITNRNLIKIRAKIFSIFNRNYFLHVHFTHALKISRNVKKKTKTGVKIHSNLNFPISWDLSLSTCWRTRIILKQRKLLQLQ